MKMVILFSKLCQTNSIYYGHLSYIAHFPLTIKLYRRIIKLETR